MLSDHSKFHRREAALTAWQTCPFLGTISLAGTLAVTLHVWLVYFEQFQQPKFVECLKWRVQKVPGFSSSREKSIWTHSVNKGKHRLDILLVILHTTQGNTPGRDAMQQLKGLFPMWLFSMKSNFSQNRNFKYFFVILR